MSVIMGSLIGFATSLAPDIIGYFKDKQDNQQELKLAELQIRLAEINHKQKLEMIDTEADIAETHILQNTQRITTGIKWVDALSATVRPVITYGFFILYLAIKIAHYNILTSDELGAKLPWAEYQTGMTTAQAIYALWSGDDAAIFAGIIAFWFGNRTMQKYRQEKM